MKHLLYTLVINFVLITSSLVLISQEAVHVQRGPEFGRALWRCDALPAPNAATLRRSDAPRGPRRCRRCDASTPRRSHRTHDAATLRRLDASRGPRRCRRFDALTLRRCRHLDVRTATLGCLEVWTCVKYVPKQSIP